MNHLDIFDLSRRLKLSPTHQGFITNRRLLLSGSDAFGRAMYSYKGKRSFYLETSNHNRISFQNLLSSLGTLPVCRFSSTL